MNVVSSPVAIGGRTALSVIGASLQHDGEALFAGLDLALEAGCWTCLLGRSGTGKSSLLRFMAGLDVPGLRGRLEAGGARAAWMAQGDLLLPWARVVDNVTIGARLRGQRPDRARALALLDQVGLAGQAQRRPATLSGGERQRVALARTLFEDRPIVLMDEPFSALDAVTRHQLQDLTARLLVGRTVCLVTHDPFEALRLGDRIAVLRDRPGRLAWIEPPPGAPPRAAGGTAQGAAYARLLAELVADAT